MSPYSPVSQQVADKIRFYFNGVEIILVYRTSQRLQVLFILTIVNDFMYEVLIATKAINICFTVLLLSVKMLTLYSISFITLVYCC